MKFLAKKLYSLNIDYLNKTKYSIFISLFLLIASITSLSTNWLNLGLDFTGGITIELQSDKVISTDEVRKVLQDNDFKDAQVIQYGTEKSIQIKLPPISDTENKISSKIQKLLKDHDYNLELLGQSVIGPQFGKELIDTGLYALALVLIGIMAYLSLRFQWKLAIGAVAALIHDLTITLGFFSIMQYEFNLTVLAALLAVLGYSVNDTVVVFDRIRENFRIFHDGNPVNITNTAINQTMSRTLITSITTLLSLLALITFGGPILFGFSIALVFGIFIGTYSSIFVASAIAIKMKLSSQDLIKKDVSEIDDLP